MAVKNVLYIGNERVVLTRNKLGNNVVSVYNKNYGEINYAEISKVLGKVKKLYIVINHDLEFSEHKTFNSKIDKKKVEVSISKSINSANVVVGNCSDVKGFASSSIDKIVNLLPNTPVTKHIKTILTILMNSNVRIRGVYSFCHLLLLLDNKNDIKITNIKIYRNTNESYISVFDGDNYVFGTRVRKRETETLPEAVLRNLIIITKYINTTLSFISKNISVSYYSQVPNDILDINQNTEAKTALSDVKIYNNLLPVSKLSSSDFVSKSNSEVIVKAYDLLKNKKLKNVRQFTNDDIMKKRKLYLIQFVLKYVSILTFIASIAFIIYTWFSMSSSRIEIKERKEDMKKTELEIKNKKEKINEKNENKFISVVNDSSEQLLKLKETNDILQKVSDLQDRFRDVLLIEGYTYSCKNCEDVEKREHEVNADIAIFNKTGSNENIGTILKEVEADVKKYFNGSCKYLDVLMPEIPRMKSSMVSSFDFRGTMHIGCLKQKREMKVTEGELNRGGTNGMEVNLDNPDINVAN